MENDIDVKGLKAQKCSLLCIGGVANGIDGDVAFINFYARENFKRL